MSNKGNCWDNAVSESFFATLKKENVFLAKYKNQAETKWGITDYIEMFYNSKKLHSFLKYKSPLDFEKKGNIIK